MTSDLMGLRPIILDSQNAMNAVDGATIVRRIRISRPDEGRGRCKASRAWDPRNDFSQPTQAHITFFERPAHLTSARTRRAFRADQGEQRQDAALAMIVGAHDQKCIFDGNDDDQRPEDQ